MANQPIMVTPESTGTTAEQRWDVLLSYRTYRRYMGSAEALSRVRSGLTAAVESARRESERRAHVYDFRGSALHGEAEAALATSLAYLDRCLQPRVDAWNRPDRDMLEALNSSLGRHS